MIKTFTEIDRDFTFPDNSDIPFDELIETNFIYGGDEGDSSKIHYHQLQSKEIYIGYQQIVLDSPINFTLRREKEVIQMHFVLKGSYELRSNDKKIVSLQSLEHNILYLTEEVGEVSIDREEPLEFVEIQLALGFVERYISQDHTLHKKIKSGKSTRLSSHNMPVNPQIRGVLNDLIRCELEGNLKGLYIRAKVIELLSLQLTQYKSSDWVDQTGLKSAYIDKMNMVRELITASPEKTYSLAHLARLAGTNEQYLKNHFKQIYGQTVFNYLTAYRMNLAKELLMSGDKKISEIAHQVGYTHPGHFSQAFKKHFGYLPLKIKGSLNALLYGCCQLLFEAENLFVPGLFAF